MATLKMLRVLVEKNNPSIHHGGKVHPAHIALSPHHLIAPIVSSRGPVQETKRPKPKKPSRSERRRCATERGWGRVGEGGREREAYRERERPDRRVSSTRANRTTMP
jgi:hypothetical protein